VRICVFCSSSDAAGEHYKAAAAEMGALIARGGHELVFGGGVLGLMGAVARAARENGAPVTGIIPRFMAEKIHTVADTVIVTGDMRERKARMEQAADAFIALPGGFGTLEEILEVLTLKQLGLLMKPAAFVNTGGFFDPLALLFESLYRDHLAKPAFRALYQMAGTPGEALDYVTSWSPAEQPRKWF
jgi:cytokinin riboside 5'-monophosphate phosphoribohydrolase